jgi:hypothetical protein
LGNAFLGMEVGVRWKMAFLNSRIWLAKAKKDAFFLIN